MKKSFLVYVVSVTVSFGIHCIDSKVFSEDMSVPLQVHVEPLAQSIEGHMTMMYTVLS